MANGSRGWDGHTLTRLEDVLAAEPCPLCAEADGAVESWFATYEHETNADPAMKMRMKDTLGLCTAHTRRLLDQTMSAGWLAAALFADVVPAGLRMLAAGRTPTEPCPPCTAAARRVDTVLGVLRAGLADSGRLRAAYEAGSGVCLPHLRALVTGTRAGVAAPVVRRLARTLEAGTGEALGALAGFDPDQRRRARVTTLHRDAVLQAEERAVKTSTAAYVELVLASPACPLCTARERARWRLYDWLGTTSTPPEELRLDAALCGAHLGDLAAAGWAAAADALTGYNADRVLADLRPAADRLAALPTGWRGAVRAPRRAVQRTLTATFRPIPCRACRVADLAERDERVLCAIVADDRSRADELARAHGLCLRHGLALAADARLPASWRDLLVTRLRLLGYELDRAARRTQRDGRWRTRGTELTAWRRAPTLLDGAVLGPRPPTAPT